MINVLTAIAVSPFCAEVYYFIAARILIAPLNALLL